MRSDKKLGGRERQLARHSCLNGETRGADLTMLRARENASDSGMPVRAAVPALSCAAPHFHTALFGESKLIDPDRFFLRISAWRRSIALNGRLTALLYINTAGTMRLLKLAQKLLSASR